MENENKKQTIPICRACSSLTDTTVTLFDLKYEHLNLSDMFELCTSLRLQVENKLFAHMCERCIAELIAAYCFIQKCRLTDSKLREQYYANTLHTSVLIKEEEKDSLTIEAPSIASLQLESKDIDMNNIKQVKSEINDIETPSTDCDSEGNNTIKLEPNDSIIVVPSLVEHPNDQSKSSSASNKNTPKGVQCEVCSLVMRPKNLKFHMMIHTGETPYMCDLCGKRFRQAASLSEHRKTHTREKPFPCEVCDKKFRSKASYKWHVAIHKSPDNPVTCEICNKVLRSKEVWKRHQSVHNKQFSCKACGKDFTTQAQLTEHTNVHLGIRPHKCAICDMGFFKKQQFTMHLLTHQTVKPHSCDMCSKSYVTKSKLAFHKKRYHVEPS